MEEVPRATTRPTGVGELLSVMRDGVARTRSELVQLTGQARSTIATKLELLQDAGLIRPAGEASSTGGRPPTAFRFDPGGAVVLAVDLGARHARYAVTDLSSRVLAAHHETIAISDGPSSVLGQIRETGRKLLEQVGSEAGPLARIGIGVPGPVDHATGRPTNPPIMPGWDGFDIPAWLGSRLGARVLVDNDVNIMAIGEYATSYRDVDNLLYVKVATGIGGGIIVDRHICRGAQGTAGDLGHVALPGYEDRVCSCGNTGCLEAVASGQAVAAALKAQGLDTNDSADVVALVRAGRPEARAAVRDAGRLIGMVLAAYVSLLNPSVIVVGGQLAQAGEELLAGIRERVYARALPLASQHLRIVASSTGKEAGVLGASIMACDDLLSVEAIDRRFATRNA